VDTEHATLNGAHLDGAEIGLAYLEGARLAGADLEGAILVETHLDGVDLSHATNLTQEALDTACGKPPKALPTGLTWGAERPCSLTIPGPDSPPDLP
jgi:hypothetical protein